MYNENMEPERVSNTLNDFFTNMGKKLAENSNNVLNSKILIVNNNVSFDYLFLKRFRTQMFYKLLIVLKIILQQWLIE